MSLLFDALFSSVALSHFIVDVFNSSRPVLLTYLGLTETQIALISTIYIWTSALTQPFFGWASDRVGPRWLAAGGVLWMTIFYTGAALIPGTGGLVCLIVAALGSSSSSRCRTSNNNRSPDRALFTASTEIGRLTASGCSVSGNATVRRNGRTGSSAGNTRGEEGDGSAIAIDHTSAGG